MFRSNNKVNPGKKEKKQSKQKLENARIERENLAAKAKADDFLSHGKNLLSQVYKPGKLYLAKETGRFPVWATIGKSNIAIPKESIVFFVGVETTQRGFSLRIIINDSVAEIRYSMLKLKDALVALKPLDVSSDS